MLMKKRLFLLLFTLLVPITFFGQNNVVISGTVIDELREPVIGASVVEKGTSNGTVTDIEGNYSLSTAPDAVLVFSYIGYASQEISVSGKTKIDVVLKEDVAQLSEVVVTGYGGSQKRATLTTAISKMDDKVLQTAAYSNVGQALQGSVTGLRVVNTTGQPGSNPNIVLRGGATISGNNNSALIIVDGIVRESMQGLSPDDIESMQILKDAASTAIYGARANGGVILIETKKGTSGELHL